MQIRQAPPVTKTCGVDDTPTADAAAAAAWTAILAIQGRRTRELRVEDGIAGLGSTLDGQVVVGLQEGQPYSDAAVEAAVRQHLAVHGLPDAVIALERAPLAATWADIVKVQQRLTRDLRAEDGIAGLSSIDRNVVTVALKANHPFYDEHIVLAVKKHLAVHGLAGASIALVRSAINVDSIVDEARAAIFQVQNRLTQDIRPEDDIVTIAGGGADGSVRVVVKGQTNSSEADILAAVAKHLTDAGFSGATFEVIRPLIQPIRVPVASAPNPDGMKATVDAFAAEIRALQARAMEDLRIEDAVDTIKVVGAKVELRISNVGFYAHRVVDWVEAELATRGVTLPMVVKD